MINTAEQIDSVLSGTFKAGSFRPSQREIISRTLSGGHSIVIMPTGMGKSLCYQLPAVMMDGLTVVISPLISLMKDQTDHLTSLGIDAAFINSTLSKSEKAERYRNISEGGYKILFVSPERFRKKSFIDVIRTRKISMLAVDEAHCISQWGNDFRPDYSRIREFRGILGNPVTLALTATATGHVQKDIIERIGIDPTHIKIFNEGICRPNLGLSVIDAIDENEKFETAFDLIKKSNGSVIVYFNLIQSIERFAEFLDLRRERYSIYHGRLAPEKKRLVQRNFKDSRKMLMLATNAFGMGIDKPDIRTIIHAEIPDSVESYYQEIGRAGRDGEKSDCVLIYCEDDLAVQINFLEWRNPDPSFIKKVYTLLQSLGENINSYAYEDLQEKLVYKNRGDHRLQTVLNIFDMHGITAGSLDTLNLRLVSDLPAEILSDEYIKTKSSRDRQRLIDMLNYVRDEKCRRNYIHAYFEMGDTECGNCDNCAMEEI